MAGSVGAEAWDASAERERSDGLGPRPQCERLGAIPARLRDKEQPSGRGEFAPPGQVTAVAGRRLVPSTAPPGRGGHPQGAVCRGQVVCAKATQFLPAQASVVGEREHQACAQGRWARRGENLLPLRIGGNPRQLGEARDQTPARGDRRRHGRECTGHAPRDSYPVAPAPAGHAAPPAGAGPAAVSARVPPPTVGDVEKARGLLGGDPLVGAAAFAVQTAAWLGRDPPPELIERARRRHPTRGAAGPARRPWAAATSPAHRRASEPASCPSFRPSPAF